MNKSPSVRIEATLTFQRNIRKLTKKYRSIQEDVQPIIEQLQQGVFLGDRIPEVGYEVFKLRIRNRDAQRGKSGGYRLIYYLKTVNRIILLTIYSKSEQADIQADAIKQIISEHANQS
ncbi:MAG: type II toxin-antitoxin system RelE/ParE family toxin [Synechococcales bacterium]|nr:type II toxin-antitoxin system RelE/ParE family toxin [Synechococcales bacterium]